MSIARLELDGKRIAVDLASGTSLAIPLSFDAEQPSFFGAPAAHREPLTSGDWVGDTRHGGSCNAETLTLTPHCNGTHTECVGHVVDQDISVSDMAPDNLTGAWLSSVQPEAVGNCVDDLPDDLPEEQLVISRACLEAALQQVPARFRNAVILRSLPNDPSKLSRNYGNGEPVPFLTAAAASYLVELAVEHLLLDVPSMDYGADPQLTAHRIFFGLPAGSRDYREAERPFCTITEMIFVPDDASDGAYLLNLHVPAFLTDAAPCRPLIYRAMEE